MPRQPPRLRSLAMLTLLTAVALGLYGATLLRFGAMMGGGR